MLLYRFGYFLLTAIFSSTMVVAKPSNLTVNVNTAREVSQDNVQSITVSFNKNKQVSDKTYNRLQKWGIGCAVFLIIAVLLLYLKNKNEREGEQVEAMDGVSEDTEVDEVGAHEIKPDKTKIDKTKTGEIKTDKTKIDKAKTDAIKTDKVKIDKTPVLLPTGQDRKPWDITDYTIYKSTIIPQDSPIVTSGLVKRSYYSYKSSKDMFQELDPKKTLSVNAANSTLFFDGGGTNQFLSARIRERQTNPSQFNNLAGRAKWGTIRDANGKIWNKPSLQVGEFVISYDKESGLRIVHILAPSGTTEGHDQLAKGIEAMCEYAYHDPDCDTLVLPVPGAGIFAGGNPSIGNGAHQAVIRGVENFLKKIAHPNSNPGSHKLTICFNWWDSRITKYLLSV